MVMMKIKTNGESKLNDSPGSTYDPQEDRHVDDTIKTLLCFSFFII